MGLVEILQRRIMPRKDESDDEAACDSDPVADASAFSEGSFAETTDAESESESLHDTEADGDPPNDSEDSASISFGALAKAQETLGTKCKLPSLLSQENDPSHPSKRLRDHAYSEALERKAGKKDTRVLSRPSKHAPAELSSKKAVSRRREVVPVPKIEARDPRFEALSGPVNELQLKKNYAFLDTYRASEISDIKSAIRKTKDPNAKEKLKRSLLSMESRRKTQEAKDREQEVLSKHRKKERELIREGKKPFYLKRGEQRKMALVERFEGMKGKEAEKVIERRRKKKAQRERRGMPEGRRGIES